LRKTECHPVNAGLNSYVLTKSILSQDGINACLEAARKLKSRVAASADLDPFLIGKFGIRYHIENELGCSWYKSDAGGLQHIVEDFINASSVPPEQDQGVVAVDVN
jgi:hypothetical protein